jgi:hypothetical protein
MWEFTSSAPGLASFGSPCARRLSMSTLSCTSGFVKCICFSVKAPLQSQLLGHALLSRTDVQLRFHGQDSRHHHRLRLDRQLQKVLYAAGGDIDIKIDGVPLAFHIDHRALQENSDSPSFASTGWR